MGSNNIEKKTESICIENTYTKTHTKSLIRLNMKLEQKKTGETVKINIVQKFIRSRWFSHSTGIIMK